MKKIVVVLVPAIFALCSFGPSAETENYSYEVLLDGRTIGTYLVNKTEVGNKVNFKVETNTSAGLIRKAEHKFVMLSSFDDSKLVSADLTTWVNQKLESSSSIHWNGDQYVKQEGEEITEICNELVTYSSACVYFQEPISKSTLFYEKYGRDLNVIDLGDHRYEVALPNGSKERYSYENGKVVTVEIVQSFATILLRANS
jgi:hypothetical protein